MSEPNVHLTCYEWVFFRGVIEEDCPESGPDKGENCRAVEDPDPAGVLHNDS